MESNYDIRISAFLHLKPSQVKNTIALFNEGATIPFISRYRKEATGSLDEVQIQAIKDNLEKLQELEKRRKFILESIEQQGLLTTELRKIIQSSEDITELEDLYLPYKPKRKTRASVAKEHGLEPLAEAIFKNTSENHELLAEKFLSENISSIEEALKGARDIIAEWISENKQSRERIRNLFEREAVVHSTVKKAKEEDAANYKDYFKYSEKLNKCPSHRMLAIRRAEDEGFLKLAISPDDEKAISILNSIFLRSVKPNHHLGEAIKDAYKRLIFPSIETEFKNSSKEKADEDAIKVFSENLKQLLLMPPLGEQRVLAIDPGYRTGCKVVCLDEHGNLLHNETIYPHSPQNQLKQAIAKIYNLVSTYNVQSIAIGNGTAGRETEAFIQKIKFEKKIKVFVVNEAGASVYSASAVAREEFPQYDVTVRGAVSIGRRLMDPLAELVKVDPKAIGIGQYQHDVDQKKLKQSLDNVVEHCVNLVGVNLNTASKHLLSYVSGIGSQLAQNIVDYRKTNGTFSNREELKKVPRLSTKAFEQCAGFLRIRNGNNPIDNSAVHPESYYIVKKMAKKLGVMEDELTGNEELLKKIKPEDFIDDKAGLPTIEDILKELAKPGLDPRNKIKMFEFTPGIFKPEQLEQGMILPGIVTNITNFGVFVDVGVKQDGLVHISELADEFVRNPADVVKLYQQVKVKVLDIDLQRKRIAFTMKPSQIL
jgi:protein Tex